MAPGIPGLEQQEIRDRVSRGSYQRLQDRGLLRVAAGLHVQPPEDLWHWIVDEWGTPSHVIADRFQVKRLRDAVKGLRIEERVTRWSESTQDIHALRRRTLDGPFAAAASACPLLAESLRVAVVRHDDAGNVRLIKRSDNVARDDVAAALLLAAGAWERARRKPRSTGVYRGAA